MAVEFKTPEQWASQYRTFLKGLKPDLNVDQQDSDWWIKSQVLGGLFSGMSQDIRKVSDDAFPQSARLEALKKHLFVYFNSELLPAQQAEGPVAVTGNTGATLTVGTIFTYSPNGNTYQSTETITLTDEIVVGTATGEVNVQSVNTGQNQNLLEGASLVVSAPSINSNAVVFGAAISDGRDEETKEEASLRILNRLRQPPAGGNENDYKTWAKEADASVVDANVIRWIYGPGTVGLVITAGTTDIDTALDNGDAIVRLPSQTLIDQVQNYVDAVKPLTDCAYVQAPRVVNVDVTCKVRFFDGDANTVPAGQTLTQAQLVQREIKRAIYKTPPGGRQFGSTGFIVASEMEELIDFNLSANPYTLGEKFQIVVDRQIQNLSATGINLIILDDEIAEPGTITIEEF